MPHTDPSPSLTDQALEHETADRRRKQLALLALLAGATGIAFAPILVRLSDVGPTAIAFWRVALAAPVLFALAALLRQRRKPISPAAEPALTSRQLWPILVLCGLMFAGDLAFWHYAVIFTTVANATLLANLAPIFVALAAWLLFRDPPNRQIIMGMAIAMAGCGVLMSTSFEIGFGHVLGDILGVITAMFYAGYQLCVSRLRRFLGAIQIMAWSSVITSPFLLVAALGMGENLLPQSGQGWAVAVAMALICHAAGQTLIAYGFAHLNPTFSSTTLLIQPVMAAVLAWILFGEALGPVHITGGLIVLFGIALAKRAS